MEKKLSKQFGELVTKLKLTRTKKELENNSIELTSKEKSELIIEGIITIILLVLLNLAIVIILEQIISSHMGLQNMVLSIKTTLAETFNNTLFYSWAKPFLIIMGLIDLIILYWRLMRRYKQMLLRHIISELHYSANGNYDHRIPFETSGDLGKIVKSINALVDSTVEAIEEERKIEHSKDELITNVSHDIRTPLTSIIGYLGLIEEGQCQSEEEILRNTHTAYLKAKQMKVLVDDLFEYTKVRQPTTPLNIISFNMTQLLEQIVVDFELEAKKRGMDIEVTTSPEPFFMEGDAEKLVRVFNNLISNALKYGKNGHFILIDAKRVGSEAIITVKNDGSTITQASLNQLFDRFYRVEESRSQKTGGTGLGLAIAQSIVVLHGGYIYATSDDNWTSFVMHLPLVQQISEPKEQQSENESNI